jgi:hypothetical protein
VKRLILVVALIAIPSVALPAKNHAQLDRPASNADVLRAWAFNRCIYDSYEGVNEAMTKDAGRAESFYLDISERDPFKLDALAKEAAKRRTPEQLAKMHHDDGPETVDHWKLMDCLEFYESSKLRAAAKAASTTKQ